MDHISFVSERQKQISNLGEIVRINREMEEINEVLSIFVEYAENVDGGIGRTWPKREKANYKKLIDKYRKLVSKIGSKTVRMIAATNTANLYLSSNCCSEIAQMQDKLMDEFNIKTIDDLDLRFHINNRDHFIFWKSVLFLMWQEEFSKLN